MSDLKERQFALIMKKNPAPDGHHTWIRRPGEIRSFGEAVAEEPCLFPDFSEEDAEAALASGEITVHSSHPVAPGCFVTVSLMEAGDYAGAGEVRSKTVPLSHVAWIDGGEGMYTGPV